MNSMLNPNASAFAYAYGTESNQISKALERLTSCNVAARDRKQIHRVLSEWYSSTTLKDILTRWEEHSGQCNGQNAPQVSPFSFVLYNVQGLNSRALEVIELIHKVEASVIICTEVGDAWNKSNIPDFKLFYSKGTNKSGGVVIGVGKHLKASQLEVKIPNTVIIDIVGLNEPLRVIGVYWPGSHKFDIKELSQFITNNSIIAGDFNASVSTWNSPSSDRRGRSVEQWCIENSLNYVSGTKNSSKRSARNIDLTFSNFPGITGETLDFGTSDHWPLVYRSECICLEASSKFEVVRWKQYELILCLLQDFWFEQSALSQPSEWYRSYIRFLNALKNRLTSWLEKEKWRPALPPEIREKLKIISKLKKRMHRKQREEDRFMFRHFSREVRKEIGEYKSSRWNSFLQSVQENNRTNQAVFWKHLSNIYRPRVPPFNKIILDNKSVTNPNQITESLFDYYKNLFSSPVDNSGDPHTNQIDKEYGSILKEIALEKKEIRPTNLQEIRRIIRELKPKKSAGRDKISNFIIKRLPPAFLECLCYCFNEWLRQGLFPDEWKIAKIITLNKLKSGAPTCEQTRPISLLATHSKIFEKILLVRVQEWATENNIIPKEQSGFQKGCLLQTRVLSIYQEVKNNLAGNVPVLGVYVDYKKAYDLVWHKGLIVKLHRMQFPLELLKILISWLDMRRAYVVFGNKASATFNIHIGLPQGSSLSPFIFIVFHADLVKCTGAFSTHLFADDLNTLIVPPVTKNLKEMLDFLNEKGTQISQEIFEYAVRWKQPVNVTKTVVQVFHSQVKKPQIDIKMNNCPLESVKLFKYLGFTWSDKMSLRPTVDKCLLNIQNSYSKLKWINRSNHISKQTLRTCFFAYSFPFFTWIFPFFPMLPQSQQELFRRKYRVGLRLVHKCPFVDSAEIYKLTKEKTLEFYVCKYLKKRLKKIYTSDLGHSPFYNDIFYWENFTNQRLGNKGKIESLGMGHLFRLSRIRKMTENHQSYLVSWLDFIDTHDEERRPQ